MNGSQKSRAVRCSSSFSGRSSRGIRSWGWWEREGGRVVLHEVRRDRPVVDQRQRGDHEREGRDDQVHCRGESLSGSGTSADRRITTSSVRTFPSRSQRPDEQDPSGDQSDRHHCDERYEHRRTGEQRHEHGQGERQAEWHQRLPHQPGLFRVVVLPHRSLGLYPRGWRVTPRAVFDGTHCGSGLASPILSASGFRKPLSRRTHG
jgi:hypothetical protein